MGDPHYKVLEGKIYFNDIDITNLKVDERAKLGIFLGMQLPLEIEGVTNADFLRTAISAKDKANFKLMPFIKELDKNVESLKMNKDMIHRGINVGFSGGERKKNEILQMYMLKPSCVLLDEIDSGLDVDSLKIVGENVTKYKEEYKPSILLITHYQRLLNYIKPDFVHIMKDGKIVKTGDASLVKEIEEVGYENIIAGN
jgi:Fe-S cluster assembly ATP-binding protein